MNSLESGSNVQSGLEMIMEKSPDTIVLVDRNLTLVKVISAKDDYYHYLANNCIGKQPQALFPDGKNYDQYEIYRAAVKRVFEEQVKVDFSFEVSFEGKNYYYLSQASLFNEELVIVYTRNVSSLKTEKNLQELINTILDRLPLGVFVKDGDNHFNYLYWNHFMEEITGIETREIEGHDDFEVNYNALMTAEERLETDMNVIKTGLTARFKGKVKSASGDYRDIEVAKYPISLNNGKPLVLALWRDITSELATENTLRRTRILTKMALRISDIRTCSIFIDPDSTHNFKDSVVTLNDWNTMSEDMIEVSWGQFISRAHPDDQEHYHNMFTRLCRGEISEARIEARMLFPGKKEYVWREVFATVYERDDKGRPSVILGCSTNIQERKNQELSLEEAKVKAEAADKMKSKYLADMSHEIRTPLNAITGFSELMAFADTDEERMSYYDVIKMNNQLLMQLINDILDISKIEADAIKITYEQLDVSELMDTIYASAKLRVPGGVKLVLEKGADHHMFGTDSMRLLQLINNLENNAIKNTKEGSITMGYTIQPDNQLRFYVRDTGIGIDKDKLKDVFGRFVKINDYMEGIGLGLAICKGLVVKMGGSIHVTSELGVGSEFSFILPSHE
ncbi:ATP-binding protein [Parabacteroides distasonis]|uniref:PAS domain-containing sensor histidine kinase n=1 Tax=Parabacteroides distasonis TaxID=823 RepID=UPI00232E9FC2|nr:ATP-binding protein [Parabacteroides distasonis]MDB9008633.1 ATP-binding protein [Parabacteroides distasonis]